MDGAHHDGAETRAISLADEVTHGGPLLRFAATGVTPTMNTHQIARLAHLLGEPARAAMLLALMDGRALTANELACAAGVAAPTASRHLAQLVEAGLLTLARQGRHRYHRLASREVAQALEGLMQLAARLAPPPPAAAPLRTGPKEASLRFARRCYDHIAGRLAVAITDRLLDDGAIVFDDDAGQLTERLGGSLRGLGIELGGDPLSAAPSARPVCRPCLDWSERRPHVAGRLGALLCSHCIERGWLRRSTDSRALTLTPEGTLVLREWLGARYWPRAGS
jgi:DNA-binding transcriptional ArsR family regulator